MLQAGAFDKRVRFEKPSDVVARFGHRAEGWALVKEAWVRIRPVGSNERLAASQMQSGQTHVVETGYHPALAVAVGSWRIVFGTRTFNIVGLPRNRNEANELLTFDCSEGGADGH
ncbi:phage head closure protein [Acidovorax sp. NPDC077693]|uniref:phage head closure protein n=1 Tax=unclassified Acidovorax TaxID=2684926 RepID=UPI0037C93389